MSSRILITGAGGFLGSRLASFLQNKKPYEVTGISHNDLELTDVRAVSSYVKQIRPDVVIHCAAISNTAVCEQNPSLSEAVNVQGTKNLAIACREHDCRLIFASSDQIYAGIGRFQQADGSGINGSDSLFGPAIPNREEDDTKLANVYARHKRQAEQEIEAALGDAICLRLTWMYDFPVRGFKSSGNLLCNLLHALLHNQPVKLPTHDFRGITWTQDVIENIETIIKFGLPGGIYNFGSPNSLSSYEIGRAFIHLLSPGREAIVEPDEERYAKKPRNLTIDVTKAERHQLAFPDTVEGLRRCLSENPEYHCLF